MKAIPPAGAEGGEFVPEAFPEADEAAFVAADEDGRRLEVGGGGALDELIPNGDVGGIEVVEVVDAAVGGGVQEDVFEADVAEVVAGVGVACAGGVPGQLERRYVLELVGFRNGVHGDPNSDSEGHSHSSKPKFNSETGNWLMDLLRS